MQDQGQAGVEIDKDPDLRQWERPALLRGWEVRGTEAHEIKNAFALDIEKWSGNINLPVGGIADEVR